MHSCSSSRIVAQLIADVRGIGGINPSIFTNLIPNNRLLTFPIFCLSASSQLLKSDLLIVLQSLYREIIILNYSC